LVLEAEYLIIVVSRVRPVRGHCPAVTRATRTMETAIQMRVLPRLCNWHDPCCVMGVRIDDNHLLQETPVNTLSSKLTALAAALVMNSLIMGAVGYLFEIQSHPHISVVSFARQVATHQWFI
jgi:hypothetical protein